MSTRWTRVVRGLAAAAIATFVAAFSHAAAGGGAPGGVGLALALAFAVVVCVLFTRRSPSLPLLGASVVLSQLAFHLLFAVGSGAGAGVGAGQLAPQGVHAGHASMSGSDLLSSGLLSSGTAPDAGAGTGAHLHDSGWMWLAHAVAALATIVLLRRGELVLRRLIELGRIRGSQVAARIGAQLTALVRVLVLLIAAEGRPQELRVSAAARPAADRLRDLGVVFGALRHRGPPRGFAVHLSA